jgi:hypothetical protein
MLPDVVTLEEQDFLAEAAETLLFRAKDPAELANAPFDALAHFRDLYWRGVRASGPETAGKAVVDKLPMNTLALPVILKLFPQAKVVFLRRDPRDVVLSCFRRRFAINPTTVEFLTPTNSANLYDEVMKLMTVYEGVLDLDLRTQGYETLVGDFEAETRALCAFAGLEWRPGMADFGARAADIATPSAGQLARGLSNKGVGHWRRYRDQLAPVLPILAPWVERFGYEPT